MINQQNKITLKKSGCYGLINKDKPEDAIELPLKFFSYDVQIQDSIILNRMTQQYVNTSGKTLDVQFIFPVDSQAATIEFQVSFNGQVVRGLVKSKQEADKIFKDAVEEGRGAAYGDYSGASRDIMRVKLGNIPAKQTINVKISFIQEAKISYNSFYQFKLSPTMTPRYALTLSENQISFKDFNANTGHSVDCEWSFKVKISSLRNLNSCFSTTHNIATHKISNQSTEIYLQQVNPRPNKDFVLTYSFEEIDKPTYSISHSDSYSTAVVSFIPKFMQISEEEAKQLIANKVQPLVDFSKVKSQFIFLLDRSGSMDGSRIQKAKDALVLFLKSLPQDCYFNVLSFGSRYDLLFEKSRKYQLKNLNEAITKIEKMKANMGGTQIYTALRNIMGVDPIEGYSRQLFFLTDGAVDDTASVIKFISNHTKYTRVNCIGIGNGCSQALIQGCAENGKGYYTYIADNEKPAQKIVALLDKSFSQLITDMKIEYDESIVTSIVPNPKKMPYFLRNDLANIYITFNTRLTKPTTLKVSYTDISNNKVQRSILLDPKNSLQIPLLSKMIDFKHVSSLEHAQKYGDDVADFIYYVKTIDNNKLRQEVIKESIQKQILTDLTAFVCVNVHSDDMNNKQNQISQKKIINLKPMNPSDHKLKVDFCNQEDQSEASSQNFVDECYIQINQSAPADNKAYIKVDPNFQKKNRLITTFVSTPNGYKMMPGNKQIENSKLRYYMNTVKNQQANGSWSNEDLITCFYNVPEIRKEMIQMYTNANIPPTVWITFLTIKYLQKYYTQNAKGELFIIIRKANAYLMKNSKVQQLEAIYKQYYQQ